MYEQFGAVIDQDKVEFKLFFPDNSVDPAQYTRGGLPKIKEIRVRGGLSKPYRRAGLGIGHGSHDGKEFASQGLALHLQDRSSASRRFYQYKYFVTFENETTRWCGDPCTKYGADKRSNACDSAVDSS
jgi:pullulanase